MSDHGLLTVQRHLMPSKSNLHFNLTIRSMYACFWPTLTLAQAAISQVWKAQEPSPQAPFWFDIVAACISCGCQLGGV
jgi:hypothetical protein